MSDGDGGIPQDGIDDDRSIRDDPLLHTLMQLAERDFSARVPRTNSGDRDDTIAFLVNSMCDELETSRAQLDQARQEAEEASRQKSRFLANMSHELRTPLNAIIGYSEMLIEEAEEDSATGYIDDLGRIERAARHLLGVINDVLDLSKIEAGRMDVYLEPVDLRGLIAEVMATVKPLIDEKENRLVLRLADDLGIVQTDVMKLRQILYNLLSNAAKFTLNGEITLAVSLAVGDDGRSLRLSVSDTGVGMTPEQVARLFQPFVQAEASTTRKFGGTGLGLAIIERFCELLGGTIDVHSEPGRGTTFTVVVPAPPP